MQPRSAAGESAVAGPGRVPLVSRLMALALKCERLIHEGSLENHAQVAVLGHVTRARVSQIMALLNLAPDIIEAVLHLTSTASGRDAVILADLRLIADEPDWKEQRERWRRLREADPWQSANRRAVGDWFSADSCGGISGVVRFTSQ